MIVFNNKKKYVNFVLECKGFAAMQFCLTDRPVWIIYWPIFLIHAANALKTALKLLYCIPDAFKITFHYTPPHSTPYIKHLPAPLELPCHYFWYSEILSHHIQFRL